MFYKKVVPLNFGFCSLGNEQNFLFNQKAGNFMNVTRNKLFNLEYFSIRNLLIISLYVLNFISSPEPKAHGELIVYQSIRRLCVCQSVYLSTLLNISISETRGPIATKFNSEASLG